MVNEDGGAVSTVAIRFVTTIGAWECGWRKGVRVAKMNGLEVVRDDKEGSEEWEGRSIMKRIPPQ